MSDIQLGQLPADGQSRDAIHVAVIPVVAGRDLWPGEHVGLTPAGEASTKMHHIGIVDPFLRDQVEKGQRFCLLLYQNSVTGMRHHWSHPTFDELENPSPKPAPDKVASEKWLRDFIENSDCPSYDVVIAAATGRSLPSIDDEYGSESYKNDGEYLHFWGRDAHSNIPPEFWDHIEVVTGVKVPPEMRAESFSCSC